MRADRFRHFMAIDWSGARGQRHKGIAVAVCAAGGGAPTLIPREQGWAREEVLDLLRERLPPDTLVGLDIGMSLPFADCGAFFPGWGESPPDARSLWALVEEFCAGDPDLGASSFADHVQASRYFRRHGGREGGEFHHPQAAHRRGRFRVTELAQERMGCRPYSNFNLVGAAQVGKSSLTGMRMLHRLAGAVPVWPVDPLPESGSMIVEIYTALAALAAGRSAGRSKIRDHASLAQALAALGSAAGAAEGPIDDHSSDAILASAWLRKVAHEPARWCPAELTPALARTEGWTFGAL